MTTETQVQLGGAPTPPPASSHRGGRPVLAVVVALLAGAGAGAAGMHFAAHRGAPDAGGGAPTAAKEQYQCPMHPTIVQDHPGDCPICGMKLVRMEPGKAVGGGERRVAFYRSPMDPKQTSPTPRKDEMGMDYVPVYEDEVNGSGASQVQGLATVDIDPARQQLIGLHTAPVTKGIVGGSWRTVGRVAVDETRVRKVNVKIAGYVERIFVDFTGKPVGRGQALFSLYSPEILAAENEYLLALQTQKALASGSEVSGSGDSLLAMARQRLRLWDIPESEIERLERTAQPSRSVTLVSPISGVVTAKTVVEGSRVAQGDTPYEITDLSQVWLLADAYERDLAQIRVGMPASLTLQAFPNRAFKGRVVFIDPVLDPKTRTAKVRVSFSNPSGALRPELFGEVVLEGATREGLRLPADAVIDSGTKSVVFVSLGNGKFQPRAVELGATSGDQVEIVSGLALGEEVVTRANFLIDSESRLRASLAAMGGK